MIINQMKVKEAFFQLFPIRSDSSDLPKGHKFRTGNRFTGHYVLGAALFLRGVDGSLLTPTPTFGAFSMHFSVEGAPGEAFNILFGPAWRLAQEIWRALLERGMSRTPISQLPDRRQIMDG